MPTVHFKMCVLLGNGKNIYYKKKTGAKIKFLFAPNVSGATWSSAAPVIKQQIPRLFINVAVARFKYGHQILFLFEFVIDAL